MQKWSLLSLVVTMVGLCDTPVLSAQTGKQLTPLGGWAGTYVGIGTVVLSSWTTEHAADAGLDSFRTVDTTAFREPVALTIDSVAAAFAYAHVEVNLEDFSMSMRSFESLSFTQSTFRLWEAITFNATAGARFVRDDDGAITGSIRREDHREFAAVHSSAIVDLAVVREDVDTAVRETLSQQVSTFTLHQNSPNPFNSSTVLRFDLASAQAVELAVYALSGQRVATLLSGTRAPGSHSVHWDGRLGTVAPLASGPYIYRLRAGDQVATRKLLLLR